MASNVLDPVRAWMRTFDVDGSGVARKEDLEPALQKLLGFSPKDTKKLLRSFQVTKDTIDYEALIAFVFDAAPAPKENGADDTAWYQASDCQRADIRSGELAWLRNLSSTVPADLRDKIVAHRGFHCCADRTRRPVENTLPAYEYAWSSGIVHCECDIQLTSDGYLILNHDEDLTRLALMMQDDAAISCSTEHRPSAPSVCNLTLKQLISMPMKSGVRQPLLKEVLDSAVIHESSQLVIEVKPGGFDIATVLIKFLTSNPAYLDHVPVVMSFDPDVVFKFAEKFPKSLKRPKVLLLTIKKPAPGVVTEAYEQLLDFDKGDVRQDVERLIVRNGVRLDGVYVEWTDKLLGDSASWLQKLCEKYTVGMWQNKGEPDCLSDCVALTRLGVSFVNTDFPKGFQREHIGKARPEERMADSLFASVVPAADGSAGGTWKERPSRADTIKALQDTQFDILIIGGGATGLGTALEATRQGYSVALVERGDFRLWNKLQEL